MSKKTQSYFVDEYVGKEEFSRRLVEKLLAEYDLKIPQKYMKDVVSAIPDVITDLLREGKGVNFHNVFKIGLKYIPQKTYSTAFTDGVPVVKPAHLTPAVKYAPTWKENLETSLMENGKVKEAEAAE